MEAIMPIPTHPLEYFANISFSKTVKSIPTIFFSVLCSVTNYHRYDYETGNFNLGGSVMHYGDYGNGPASGIFFELVRLEVYEGGTNSDNPIDRGSPTTTMLS